MIAEMSICREPYIGGLYKVKYHHDNGVMEYLQTPGDFLHALHHANVPIKFVHFYGGGRPNRTFRRPTPVAADAAEPRR